MLSSVAPVLQYVPMEDMVANFELYPYISRLAYCNLRIQYRMMVRDKISKEILAPSLPHYDDVRSYFRSVQDAWSESEACMRLRAIIESARPQCDKIIGFALGTVTQEFQESWPQRSAFQHALLLFLRDAFCPCQPEKKPIVCFAQDPAYIELDKSLFPDIPVKEVVFELADPAVIIWDTIGDSASDLPRSDPESPRVREKLRANYDRIDFPGEHIYFGDLSVYVRR
nr:hypothetical protein CFP56_34785 [Quercus suber]